MANSVVRKCGTKRDTYDSRDKRKVYSNEHIFGLVRQQGSFSQVDLRPYMSYDVYDQGDLSSCTANAVCAAYVMDLEKQPKYHPFEPSRLFLYYNTREMEGRFSEKDDGGVTSIRDVFKALNRKGVCKEPYWPYYPYNVDTKPPEKCYKLAQGNYCAYERLLDHHATRVTDDSDIHQLKASLNDKCPIVFAFEMYENFQPFYDDVPTAARNGFIMPKPKGKKSSFSHAVVAVGYNDRIKCITVLNSWGENWGDRGYFYMPYDIITDGNICFDFWSVTYAFERPADM